MTQGKANLTYYIFEGVLTGTLNGNHVNIFAYSGGGGMSKKGITDSSVVNNPYYSGKKQDYSGKENAQSEKRGGPIPPGRYRIDKPVPWGQSKKAVLEPIGGTAHTLAAFNRGGFLIHGQGALGSDGCIVPTSGDAFRKLMEGLEADGGGMLWVCETLGVIALFEAEIPILVKVIKRKTMVNSAQDLYHSILLRAADEWGVEYEDLDRDIGQQFDPVVRFLAGACASELERVYQHLHETEGRLQERLTKVLLPEYFHLPMPAHALATATPAGEPVVIDETTGFALETQDNGGNISFSPLFQTRLLPVTLKIIATENKLIDVNRRHNPRRGIRETGDEFGRILVGFESAEFVGNWQGASLSFDLRGRSDDATEKAKLFATLPGSRCFLNGRKMNVISGLPESGLLLEDYLNGNERLQSRVRARYEREFLTFTDNDIPESEPRTPQEFLPQWFANSMLEPEAVDEQLSRLDASLKQPLHWMEIHLAYPVELQQLEARLSVRFNVFPVVNRRLCGEGNGEHHYLQTTTIKWLHLQPKEDFVSIRRVYEEKPPENQTFTFKPFSDFKEDRKPGYTLRHGGIGRWDDFNAWQRLAYVIAVLQENYQHNELIQKAASSLSLEDVHHLLGKKILENASVRKPTRDIYVLLHSGLTTNVRVRVEYWTSQGAEANGIIANSALKCTSRQKSGFSAESIKLITPTTDGRNPLEATEQLDAMKSTLLSRGRIVTREDVKTFCREFLKEKLSYISIQDGVGVDPRLDLGMTRLLDVLIKPAPIAIDDDWEGICQQLRGLLEQKSASSIPIRVRLAIE